jgi:hypothetical protein
MLCHLFQNAFLNLSSIFFQPEALISVRKIVYFTVNLFKNRYTVEERNKFVPLPSLFWFIPFHYRTVERFQKVPLEFRSASFLTGADWWLKRN